MKTKPWALPAIATLAIAVAGCAGTGERETEGPPRKETIIGLTDGGTLVKFNAGQPQKATTIGTITGLQAGESLVGIDYRVNKGVLFGLSSASRIYTIDATNAKATAVGAAPLALKIDGAEFGFDFNPTVDRIRIVSDKGQNMRAHPDTGASVDGNATQDGVQPDGPLAYAASDRNAGKAPKVIAAGYTYNKTNEKITTNYAIDAATGSLVMQGSKEGATPAVSPNTGQLYTVGSLGVGAFGRASFDISDVNNSAYAAITHDGQSRTRFYLVDLDSGKATFIGTVGGQALKGMAIEP